MDTHGYAGHPDLRNRGAGTGETLQGCHAVQPGLNDLVKRKGLWTQNGVVPSRKQVRRNIPGG